LAILRSSGVGVILVSHLPSQIQPGVLALCQLVLTIGGVHGGPDREVVAKLLSLNRDQERQLGRMQPREVLGFYAGSQWPRPIHGWTADMSDPHPNWPAIEERSKAFIAGLGILPYQNPWEFREVTVVQPPPGPVSSPMSAPLPVTEEPAGEGTEPAGLPTTASRLLWDLISYPFSMYSVRLIRLELSARAGLTDRRALEQAGYARSILVGQAVYLVATIKGYESLNQKPPTWLSGPSFDHAFLQAMAQHIISKEASVARIEVNVPVDEKGSAVDMVVHRKDGSMEAVEVTCSVNNVTGNAVKCGGAGFQRIVFLCRDCDVRAAVKKRVERSGLPGELRRRLRYPLFSNLTKKDPA
jgi:hypothetical protein